MGIEVSGLLLLKQSQVDRPCPATSGSPAIAAIAAAIKPPVNPLRDPRSMQASPAPPTPLLLALSIRAGFSASRWWHQYPRGFASTIKRISCSWGADCQADSTLELELRLNFFGGFDCSCFDCGRMSYLFWQQKAFPYTFRKLSGHVSDISAPLIKKPRGIHDKTRNEKTAFQKRQKNVCCSLGTSRTPPRPRQWARRSHPPSASYADIPFPSPFH